MRKTWILGAACAVAVCALIIAYTQGGLWRTREYRILVSGSTSVLPLMEIWAQEFMEKNPAYKIDVSGGGSGKGIRDVAAGVVDIGMHSRPYEPDKDPEFNRVTFAVANDAVLVVVNKQNPLYGVTRELLQAVWGYGKPEPKYPVETYVLVSGEEGVRLVKVTVEIVDETTHRVKIVGEGLELILQPYTRAESSGTAETFASFLAGGKGKQAGLKGKAASGNVGMVQAVKKDPNAIAYIAKGYFDPAALKCLLVIVVEDGKWSTWNNYEYDEYRAPTDAAIARGGMLQAIAKGPGEAPGGYPIARELYVSVNLDKYEGRIPKYLAEFLEWCFTEGQKLVEKAHYVKLMEEQAERNLELLEKASEG